MHFKTKQQARRTAGFTMIELLTVVAIIAILAAIGYPSYLESIAKSRRAEARTALQEAVQYMQRFYVANDTYEKDLSGTNVALPPEISKSPKNGTASYIIGLVTGSVTGVGFVVEAVPTGADKCGSFRLNERGQRSLANATVADQASCWR